MSKRYSPSKSRPTLGDETDRDRSPRGGGLAGGGGGLGAFDTNEIPSIKKMAERMAQLENIVQQLSGPGGSGGGRGAEARLAAVEASVEHIRKTVENTLSEGRETHRLLLQLQGQVGRQAGVLEAVQHDVDSRRG